MAGLAHLMESIDAATGHWPLSLEAVLTIFSGVAATALAVEATRKPNHQDAERTNRSPRWELFWVSNLAALLLMGACGVHLLRQFQLSAEDRGLGGRHLSVSTVLSIVGGLASCAYLLGYCAVGLAGAEVDDAWKTSQSGRSSRNHSHSATPRKEGEPADVIIVGAGTAGASLAAVLARQGRQVTVIESQIDIPVRPID